MRRHSMGHRTMAVAVAAALALTPASVVASGFQLVEQNGSGLGNAFAGQAAGVQDASAVFFNPAALTRQARAARGLDLDRLEQQRELADRA